MNALATDFIEILAQAVASKIQLETSISKRVFNLDEAAAYCGLTRDSFKKKVVRDRIEKVRLDKFWRFDKADLDACRWTQKDEITGKAASARSVRPKQPQGREWRAWRTLISYWCGWGDLFFDTLLKTRKLLVLGCARKGKSGRNAQRGHNLGTLVGAKNMCTGRLVSIALG